MKIQKLKIIDFKLLKDFDIIVNKHISLFIGKNGSGKSTFLEAIAWIFKCANLHFIEKKGESTPFDFEITYEVRLEKTILETSTFSESHTDYVSVTIKGCRKGKSFWSISTDNAAYNIEQLIQRHGMEALLPTNILVYYSGWFETMQFLCKEHEDLYKERLLEVKSDTDISISSEELYSRIGVLPMLYIQKQHFEILLASLFAYEYSESVTEFFNKQLGLGIPDKNPLTVFLKKRQWLSGAGPEDFWGAKGLLRGFLDVIKRFAYHETLNYRGEDTIVYNFHLKDWHSLREFYGEEKKLFYLLHMLHASEMLGGIQLFMDKPKIAISHHDLSEGEQQLITIKAMNELLIERNTLLLFDEPDTYLHPQWQGTFLNSLHEFIDIGEFQPQFLIASHSTIMLSNLKDGDLFKMREGKAIPISEGYYGREYGFNLSAVMDGNERVPEVQEQFDLLFELIDSEQLEKASQLLRELKEKHNDDPQLTKAETMIAFFRNE